MEIKTKAIVITSKDSGDKDKLITLFSLSNGIIKAKLKGVKSAKAKLKFAKEPFCFADFILNDKNGFLTVVSADCIDTFYSIITNYTHFLEASQILKMITIVGMENQPNAFLFVECLKALKTLAYSNVKENLVSIKFLLNLFYNEGYEIAFEKCSACGTLLGEYRFLNLDTGEVLCSSCKNDFYERISLPINSVLKLVANSEYDTLENLKLDKANVSLALSILFKNFEKRFK